MLQQYGMRLFYGFFILLFIGMAVLSLIDADLPPTDATVEFERDTATTLIVDVVLPLGELQLQAGPVEIMHAEFEYEDEDATVRTTYREDGALGNLSVEQNGDDITTPADNHFDITLSDDLPLALSLVRETGPSMLDLRDLRLNELAVLLGSGENLVRLGPAYPLLVDLDIEGGTATDVLDMVCICDALQLLRADLSNGHDALYLDGEFPELTSLDLDLDSGDDALRISGQYDAISTLTVALGPGDDRLVMDGFYPALQQFFIQVGTGNDIIDLSHEWDHSLEIDVVSQSNSTLLYLPQMVGVAVTVRDPGVEISTTNMQQDGDLWVNNAYATSDITLQIFISTANVEQVELISGPPRTALIERNLPTDIVELD